MCGHGVNLSVHEGTYGSAAASGAKGITSHTAISPQKERIGAQPQQNALGLGLSVYGVVVAK
jgi:hypothetical protein